jgi:hypothetical protein
VTAPALLMERFPPNSVRRKTAPPYSARELTMTPLPIVAEALRTTPAAAMGPTATIETPIPSLT